MSSSSPLQQQTVVARPNPGGPVVLAAMLGIFGASAVNVLLKNPPESDIGRMLIAALGLLCTTGALLCLWWPLSQQIVAAPRHLRWRHWFGWQSVGWDEVTDYFTASPGKDRTRLSVVTSRETIEFGSDWLRSEHLKQVIVDRAREARARTWDLRLAREEDPWPRTFDYAGRTFPDSVWHPPLAGLGLIVLMLVVALPMIRNAWSESQPIDEWIYGLPVLGLGFLYAGLMSWPGLVILQDTRKRAAQRITATPDGLLFEDTESRIESRWSEITSTEILPLGRLLQLDRRRHVITTNRGTIEFTPLISDFEALERLIDEKATDRIASGWTSPEGELPGRPFETTGSCTFHYRTRGMRTLLRAATVLVLVIAAATVRKAMSEPVTDWSATMDDALVPAMLVGGYLLFWGWYRKAAVRLTEQGVTKISLLGTRSITWPEIREYYEHARDRSLVLKGANQTLSFFSGLVGRDELMREIARRATQAKTRRWEKLMK